MSELEHDRRATAEDIAADAARLTGIEEENAGMEPDDPRLGELSAESERLARRIVPKTAAERELAERAAEPGAAPD